MNPEGMKTQADLTQQLANNIKKIGVAFRRHDTKLLSTSLGNYAMTIREMCASDTLYAFQTAFLPNKPIETPIKQAEDNLPKNSELT